MSFVAVSTTLALLGLHSPWLADRPAATRVLLLVAIEHALFIAKAAIAHAIPDEPLEVRQARAKKLQPNRWLQQLAAGILGDTAVGPDALAQSLAAAMRAADTRGQPPEAVLREFLSAVEQQRLAALADARQLGNEVRFLEERVRVLQEKERERSVDSGLMHTIVGAVAGAVAGAQ